jgi:hypothetical protein
MSATTVVHEGVVGAGAGAGAGGTYVQLCESTGVPVQPAGEVDERDRVCVPFDWQVPHEPYV